MFTHDNFPVLKRQNYQVYNRSDMYVPNVGVRTPFQAVAIATPYTKAANVHSVPVTYSTVKGPLIGARGMRTPVKAVDSIGS